MPGRVLVVALALSALLLPAIALGHEGDPNYSSEVREIDPDLPGVHVEVLDHDDSLRLRNDGDTTIVVVGYEDEPYVRIRDDGTVEVNRRSPTHYLNEDRFARVDVPAEAEGEAAPEWELVDRSSQYDWHDHRVHYMGEGTPPQVEDEDERAKVFDYVVPLDVGEVRAEVHGTLWWVGRQDSFQVAPFAALAAFVLVAVAVAVVARRRGRRRATTDPCPDESREAW